MDKKPTHNQIEDLLAEARQSFRLDTKEQADMKIRLMDVINNTPGRSDWWKYTFKSQERYSMFLPILIAAFIALGSGTAVLANSAKPGDALFPLDQWIESINQNLTPGQSAKAQLLASFSEERIAELAALQEEKSASTTDERRAKWEARQTDAEARVAASIERVESVQDIFEEKLANAKDDKQKEVFQKVLDRLEKVAEKRAELLEKIQEREFPEDKVKGNAELRARLNAWLQLTPELRAAIREEIAEDFRSDGRGGDDDDDDEDSDDDSDDSDDSDNDSDDDEDGDDDDDDEDSDDDSDDNGLKFGNNSLIESGVNQILNGTGGTVQLEAEADIFTDLTSVEVELNDVKTNFTTSATTRAGIINAILAKVSGVTYAQVDAVLDIEVEDRASEPDDLD